MINSESRHPNRVQETTAVDRAPVGMLVSAQDPAIITALGSAGYDFVIIEYEHGPIDADVARRHVDAAHAAGLTSLARGVTSDAFVRLFVDIGCQGIVFSHIATATQAEEAVELTRRHSLRRKAEGNPVDRGRAVAIFPSVSVVPFCGVIVESRRGVDNVSEIAAVEGVDLVLFGPGDYASEIGAAADGWSNAAVQAAWKRVGAETKVAGKMLGAATLSDSSRESLVEFSRSGADLIVTYVDLLLTRQHFESQLHLQALGEVPTEWVVANCSPRIGNAEA